MNNTDAIALAIAGAYRQHVRITAIPATGPADSVQAYAVQGAVWRALAGGARPTAWKVGTPAPDVVPVAAAVLPSRLAVGPADFPRDLFRGLGVEAEIAVRFGRDLAPGAGRAEILGALAGVHVAMELVDTRLADAEAAGPLWRLADSLVNGALVLGDAIPGWRGLDWPAQVPRIRVDGAVLAEGGSPPLGDLFHCLPWWLGHVGGARAGDIVTTGAWSGMHPVALGAELVVEFTGLGRAVAKMGRL